MKKNIIITAGPTNERIDAVMKITNMSTGALGSIIADTFLEDKEAEIGTIFYISTKLSYKPKVESDKIKFIMVDSTQDLIDALKNIFEKEHVDIMIHSAAVGDYTGKYVIRAEDLVNEIWRKMIETQEISSKDDLMKVFEMPEAICNDSTKISSYESHLMTMFKLTPKVISLVKKMTPDITLVGFKLLEGVSKDQLFDVASRLRQKNDANFIVANDLSKIGNGKHWAMIINKDGIQRECQTKKEIAVALENLLF